MERKMKIRKVIVKIILTLFFWELLVTGGIVSMEPKLSLGQSKKKTVLPGGVRKDPFALPSGVRLLSQEVPILDGDKKLPSIHETRLGEITPAETKPPEAPLKLKAILISDHVRLASIDRSIVTIGDPINGEKVIDIQPDRVVLAKEGKKRTILLEQSPVKITVEGR